MLKLFSFYKYEVLKNDVLYVKYRLCKNDANKSFEELVQEIEYQFKQRNI